MYKAYLNNYKTVFNQGREMLLKLCIQIRSGLFIQNEQQKDVKSLSSDVDALTSNPFLRSTVVFVKSEILLQVPGADYIVSLTYQGEVCSYVNGAVVRRIDTLRNIDTCFDYRTQTVPQTRDVVPDLFIAFNQNKFTQYRTFYNFDPNVDQSRIQDQFYYMLQYPTQYSYEELFEFMHLCMMIIKVKQNTQNRASSKTDFSRWRNVYVRNSSDISLCGVLSDVEIDGVQHATIDTCSDTKCVDSSYISLQNSEQNQIFNSSCVSMSRSHRNKVAEVSFMRCIDTEDVRIIAVNYAVLESCISSSFKHITYLQAFSTLESYSNGNVALYLGQNSRIYQQSFTRSLITVPQNSVLYTADSLRVFHSYIQFPEVRVCQPTKYCVNLSLPVLWEVNPSFCYTEGRMFGYNAQGEWVELFAEAIARNSAITTQGAQVEIDSIEYLNRNIEVHSDKLTEENMDVLIVAVENADTINAVYLNDEKVRPKTLEITFTSPVNVVVSSDLTQNLKLTGEGSFSLSGTTQMSTLYFYGMRFEFEEKDVPQIRKLNNIQFIADNLHRYDFEQHDIITGLFARTTLGNINNSQITRIPTYCFYATNWTGNQLVFENVETIDEQAFIQNSDSTQRNEIRIVLPKIRYIGSYAFQKLRLYSLQRSEGIQCTIDTAAFEDTNLQYINLINTVYPDTTHGHVVYNSDLIHFITNNSGNTFGQLTKCRQIVVHNIDDFKTQMIKLPSNTQFFTNYKHLVLTTDGILVATKEHYDVYQCQVLMIQNPSTDVVVKDTVTTLVVKGAEQNLVHVPENIAYLKMQNKNEVSLPGTIRGINMSRAFVDVNFEINGYEFMCKYLRWGNARVQIPHDLVNFNTSLFTHQLGAERKLSFVNALNVVFDATWENFTFQTGGNNIVAYVFDSTRSWVETHAKQITSGEIEYVDLGEWDTEYVEG